MVWVGSTVHGLNVNDGIEDRDEMSICVEPLEEAMALREPWRPSPRARTPPEPGRRLTKDRLSFALSFAGESPQLAGTFRISNIEFEKEELPRPTSPLPEKASPLSGVAQRDSTVTFSWKNGNDTDRFELRLLADGRRGVAVTDDRGDAQGTGGGGNSRGRPHRA